MKNKTTDYILGFITGIAISIAAYSCTTSPLQADESYSSSSPSGSIIDPIYVKLVD